MPKQLGVPNAMGGGLPPSPGTVQLPQAPQPPQQPGMPDLNMLLNRQAMLTQLGR